MQASALNLGTAGTLTWPQLPAGSTPASSCATSLLLARMARSTLGVTRCSCAPWRNATGPEPVTLLLPPLQLAPWTLPAPQAPLLLQPPAPVRTVGGGRG
jgi:hypothetical protein